MQTKLIVAIAVLIAAAAAGAALIAWPAPYSSRSPNPMPTLSPATQPFTSENVIVEKPLPNSSVSRAFTVEGRARGNWFFEASFPVQVRDPSNNTVGTGFAQTGDNWMTAEFVPYAAVVTVAGYSGPARLVLMKDNPSGLPEFDDAVEFDIIIR